MAPNEFVEIRLVCKADYLDPQLKIKLHEIKDKLREILHTGRRRFALKKVQPWNSVKVTFDIPKEAADHLRLLAVQGNVRLIELGILSVEIVGQSSAIVLNANNNTNNVSANPTTTNSNDSSVASKPLHSNDGSTINTESATNSSAISSSHDTKIDDRHRHKRVKLEHDFDHPTLSSTIHNTPQKDRSIPINNHNLVQAPTTMINSSSAVVHQSIPYGVPQSPSSLAHRPTTPSHSMNSNYIRVSHTNSIVTNHPGYVNNVQLQTAHLSNSYSVPSVPIDNSNMTNGITNEMHNYAHPQQVYHQEPWSVYPDPSNTYKMKVNGVRSNHYYGQQQPLILSDNTSLSSSSAANMFCASTTSNQYDLRRCETTMTTMNASSTNLANNYDASSS